MQIANSNSLVLSDFSQKWIQSIGDRRTPKWTSRSVATTNRRCRRNVSHIDRNDCENDFNETELSRESSLASALYICPPLLHRTRVFFCEVISRANSSHRFLSDPRNWAARLAMCGSAIKLYPRVIIYFLRTWPPYIFVWLPRIAVAEPAVAAVTRIMHDGP